MPAKRISAFDQAIEEKQRQATQAPPVIVAPVPTPQPEQKSAPPASEPLTRNPVGRPKGVPKVKQNFYLTTAPEDLTAAQLELAVRLKLLVKDKGTMVDLAMSFLRSTLEEATSSDLEKVQAAYTRVINEQSNSAA